MEKTKNLMDHIIKAAELQRMFGEFNFEILLKDKEFQAPRSYGHAEYRIIGGHSEWKQVRDASKIYFFFRLDKTFNFLGNQIKYDENGIPVRTVCLSVVRLGGYSGTSRLPTLQKLIESFGLKYRV